MTQLLELAVEAARQLSPEEQDEIARMIMGIVGGTSDDVYVLSDDENAAIDLAMKQIERGEYATEEDLQSIFDKHRTQ